MRRSILPFLLVLAVALLLGGCSNLTPRQNYRLDRDAYVIADVVLTAGVVAHKIPAADVPVIQAGLGVANQRLADAAVWIAANPALADTPGVYPPSLDPLKAAIDVLNGYLLKYALLAPLPPAVPPAATQPTTKPGS